MERRNTIQKELVLKAVNSLMCHATADEIYSHIKKDYPSIGKGTVYRNLNILAMEEKILKIEVPGDPDRFDHTIEKHYHAKCIKCGKIFDVDMEPVINLEGYIKDKKGIEIVDYDILFKGICKECKEEEK